MTSTCGRPPECFPEIFAMAGEGIQALCLNGSQLGTIVGKGGTEFLKGTLVPKQISKVPIWELSGRRRQICRVIPNRAIAGYGK